MEKEDQELFFSGLEENDIEILSKIAKSDVHNHAGRGGKIEDLSLLIQAPQHRFYTLDEMQEWFVNNVKEHCLQGVDGYLYRVEASFRQAARDNIRKLALSFGIGEVGALGGMETFSKIMDTFKRKSIPDAEFLPELSLLRSRITHNEVAKARDILSSGWFASIDVCGDELVVPLDNYVSLYRYAKSQGMMLKVHVGEFGSAKGVRSAVDLLELDEVHHGIAAASSPEVMKYLEEHSIILNVCPMINIMLNRVDSYANHPIRDLVDAGVKVTINTDDLAIFNATVSQEYLNLYTSRLFSKEELNTIRLGGLSAYKKYQRSQ